MAKLYLVRTIISKDGDKIVLAGYGLIDGIKTIRSKHDTYTVTERTHSTYISLIIN